jgi:hypothetical protein
MKKLLAICCLVTFFVGVGLAKADTITFNEQTFTGWNLTVISGSLGDQSGRQIATGGHPDKYWEVTTNVNTLVFSRSTNASNFSYDPGTGAIESIDFSFDFNPISAFGQGQAVGIVLEQAGTFYSYYDGITGNTSGWDAVGKAGAGLLATNFLAQSGTGNPNFSAAGAPITIGLLTGNSGGQTIAVGYDNFSVTLNRVPTPSSFAALIGMGLVGLVGVARRRWKKS